MSAATAEKRSEREFGDRMLVCLDTSSDPFAECVRALEQFAAKNHGYLKVGRVCDESFATLLSRTRYRGACAKAGLYNGDRMEIQDLEREVTAYAIERFPGRMLNQRMGSGPVSASEDHVLYAVAFPPTAEWKRAAAWADAGRVNERALWPEYWPEADQWPCTFARTIRGDPKFFEPRWVHAADGSRPLSLDAWQSLPTRLDDLPARRKRGRSSRK